MNRQLWTAMALLALLAMKASAQPEDSLIAVSADIVEISGSYEKDLGFSWTPFQAGVNFAEKAIPAGAILQVGDFARTTQLNTSLKLLETEGKAQLLSNPKVIVQAQSQANFVVGGEQPYPTANGNGTVTTDFTVTRDGDGDVTIKYSAVTSQLEINIESAFADKAIPVQVVYDATNTRYVVTFQGSAGGQACKGLVGKTVGITTENLQEGGPAIEAYELTITGAPSAGSYDLAYTADGAEVKKTLQFGDGLSQLQTALDAADVALKSAGVYTIKFKADGIGQRVFASQLAVTKSANFAGGDVTVARKQTGAYPVYAYPATTSLKTLTKPFSPYSEYHAKAEILTDKITVTYNSKTYQLYINPSWTVSDLLQFASDVVGGAVAGPAFAKFTPKDQAEVTKALKPNALISTVNVANGVEVAFALA